VVSEKLNVRWCLGDGLRTGIWKLGFGTIPRKPLRFLTAFMPKNISSQVGEKNHLWGQPRKAQPWIQGRAL